MSRLNRVLTEAHALLGEALNRVDSAHQAMSDQAPGYTANTLAGRSASSCSCDPDDPHVSCPHGTQPERLHGTLSADPARSARWRLNDLTRRISGDVEELYTIVTKWGVRRVPLADGPEEGWCVSCFRDGGYHEPIAQGVYSRFCQWCGRWVAEYRRDDRPERDAWPPVILVQKRHRNRRITMADVEDAMRDEKAS